MTSSESNFAFLKDHNPVFFQLTRNAEKIFAIDPNASLIKFRQFGEALAQDLAIRVGFNGQCISGDIESAQTLILSINPGGEVDQLTQSLSYSPALKYFSEYEDKLPFAQIMVWNLCHGEPQRMHRLAESYLLGLFQRSTSVNG